MSVTDIKETKVTNEEKIEMDFIRAYYAFDSECSLMEKQLIPTKNILNLQITSLCTSITELMKVCKDPERFKDKLSRLLFYCAAFHYAFPKNIIELVNILLKNGADVSAKVMLSIGSIGTILDLLRPDGRINVASTPYSKSGLEKIIFHHIYLQRERRARDIDASSRLPKSLVEMITEYAEDPYPIPFPGEDPIAFPEIYAQVLSIGRAREKRAQHRIMYKCFESGTKPPEQMTVASTENKTKVESEFQTVPSKYTFSELPEYLSQLCSLLLKHEQKSEAEIKSFDDISINETINEYGRTILDFLEGSGYFFAYKKLVALGAKSGKFRRALLYYGPGYKIYGNHSSLIQLIRKGNVEGLRILLEGKTTSFDVNELCSAESLGSDRDTQKMTALLWCLEPRLRVAFRVARFGVSFPNDGITYQMIELLLVNGADLTLTNAPLNENEIELSVTFEESKDYKEGVIKQFFSRASKFEKCTPLDRLIQIHQGALDPKSKLVVLFAQYIYADLIKKHPNRKLTVSDFAPYSAQQRGDKFWEVVETIGREAYQKDLAFKSWLQMQKPGF